MNTKICEDEKDKKSSFTVSDRADIDAFNCHKLMYF